MNMNAQSLAFRANLAQLVSPLLRVRTKTPFFKLQAHRIPTLWTLYRGLLRDATSEDVRFRIRVLFRQRKGSTGLERTVRDLKQGYKWLDFFEQAADGDAHCQAVMHRFSRLISAKREKVRMLRLAQEEIEWQAKLRHRPMLTGGYMRPTVNHGPLPRMKPQPPAISHLIVRRLKKRELRFEKKAQFEGYLQDLELEHKFEEGVQQLTGANIPQVFSGPERGPWREAAWNTLRDIKESQIYEYNRAAKAFSPELMARIMEARREKNRNKTREKERERRGEDTKASLRRKRQEPPAHILAQMSPRQREMDKVSRSLSEAGYVGLVKKRLGFKLKNPKLSLELGDEENRPLLDEATRLVRAENQRRRQEVQKIIGSQ